VGVGVGVAPGVAVGVDVGAMVPSGVVVTPGVPVGDGVPVWVGVALGLVVALGEAVGLNVGIPVEETMVGPGLRARGPRPQDSSVANSAIAPAPVKKRRRLNSRRDLLSGDEECFLVIPPIIGIEAINVKRARQTSRRRFPYAGVSVRW
jgi:hypothetical protein